MKSKYLKLQNGSDIRGVAIDGIEGETPNLTTREAIAIGQSFAMWLSRKLGKEPKELKLAVGRDPRVSGPDLLKGLAAGFGLCGSKALDMGLASTPAMFMATLFPQFKCDGTIMITASHLPFNRNGFKFFTSEGGLDKKDITEILELAADLDNGEVTASVEPDMENADIMTPYSAHLRELIVSGAKMGERPLEGMKIVVDAGNGSGGFYATDVLAPLGADVSESQFLEPDGMFPNHAPNPENKEAMDSISNKVIDAKADLGLIFDTDVDRSAAVDSKGREIARNGIIAMAAALVAEDHPGTTIVTDSITSRQLTEYLEKNLGLKHYRFKRGYKNVINKSKELNEQGIDSQLAIETSGHAALKENYFLDDGAYLATKIVIKATKLFKDGLPIDSVIAELQDPADEEEIRIPILCDDFSSYGDKVLRDLEDYVLKVSAEGADAKIPLSLETPNYEGVRINFPDGWCLLRKSLHDPILPLNIASDVPGGCASIRKVLADFLADYDQLDISKMTAGKEEPAKRDPEVVTCDEMKALERTADEHGLSYYQMMENAGTRAYQAIMIKCAGNVDSAIVFCGKGNNGGDGFVVARKLHETGCDVRIVLVGGEPKTEDAITNHRLIKDELETMEILDSEKPEWPGSRPDIVVDAIYGTGFHGNLSGSGLEATSFINRMKADGSKVFALDIPSGMGGDLTEADGIDPETVRADYTITFHARKPVHMQSFSEEYCGEVIVADIGITKALEK